MTTPPIPDNSTGGASTGSARGDPTSDLATVTPAASSGDTWGSSGTLGQPAVSPDVARAAAASGPAVPDADRGEAGPAGPNQAVADQAGTDHAETDHADADTDTDTDHAETLAIDIGGTGLKASVLDAAGEMERDRVRIDTPYPLSPDKMVHVLTDLVKPLGSYDRASVGFPGMVREGKVLSAPHFVSPAGPGGSPTAKLTAAWDRFDLQDALTKSLGKPTKVANDADLQGAAVVQGQGLEMVVTLGTGVGSALFYQGRLMPHLELAHHAFRKDQTYNEALGEAARKQLGHKKWNKRVAEMITVLRALTFFDHLYIGGGNSTRVDLKLDGDVTLVDNSAGILGGIKLWHRST